MCMVPYKAGLCHYCNWHPKAEGSNYCEKCLCLTLEELEGMAGNDELHSKALAEGLERVYGAMS